MSRVLCGFGVLTRACSRIYFDPMGGSSNGNGVAEHLGKVMDAGLFRALCEPVRVDILAHLALHGPGDIGEIAQAFPQDRSVISRHLQQLAQVGILERRKESRRMVYSVNGAALLRRMEQMTDQVRTLVHKCCPSPDDPND